MAQATDTQVGEIRLAGDLAGDGGAQVGTNPQLKTMPGLVPGQYNTPRITVDSKGRITAIAPSTIDAAGSLPSASTTVAGVVRIGDNIHLASAGEPGHQVINYGGVLTTASATGLAGGLAKYSFRVAVDGDDAREVEFRGSNAPTIGELITYLNAYMESIGIGAALALTQGNLVLSSKTLGILSTIALSNDGLFSDITGYVGVESPQTGVGAGQIYVKQGSTSDLGVVKIGDGIAVDNGVISIDYDAQPIATDSAPGMVSVAPGGHLTVDAQGALSVPAATTSTPGVVRVGSGLTVTDGVVAVDTSALPNATTTTKGVVRVGTGLTVSNGTLSIDTSTIVLPDATTSTKGVVQVGNNVNVASGVISVPAATTSTLGVVQVGAGLTVSSGVLSVETATTTKLGAVKVGAGLSVTVDGTISAAAIPDATTTSKGLVQVGDGLSVTNGVITTNLATASQVGVVRVGAGLSASAGVLSIAAATTTTLGGVKAGSGLNVAGDGTLSAVPIGNATTTSKGIVQAGSGLTAVNGVLSVPDATPSAAGVARVGSGLTVTGGVIAAALANGSNPGLISSVSGQLSLSNGVLNLTTDVVRRDQYNTYTGVQSSAVWTAPTTTNNVNLSSPTSNIITWTNPSANTTITYSGAGWVNGGRYTLIMNTHSSQSTVTWPAGMRIKGYTTPSQGGVDIIEGVVYNGVLYGTYTKGYSA